MGAEQHTELAALGREVGLTFSEAARLVGVERQHGMDDLLRFKVEVQASDWPAVRESLPIDQERLRPGTRGYLGQDAGFWDPHQATRLMSGQVVRDDGRTLSIGIDDGQPGKVVLFIVEHGT